MINSKNFLTYFIIYITICCGLFHLIYWGEFNIDAAPYISIQDIIKSAFQPLSKPFIFTFIGTYFALRIFKYFVKYSEKTNPSEQKPKDKRPTILSRIFVFLIFFFIFFFIFKFIDSISLNNKFLLLEIFLYIFVNIFFDINLLFDNAFKPIFDKEFIVMFIIYFACNSISTAYEKAEPINSNSSYQYIVLEKHITDKRTKRDTMKLVGISDQNYVFTNMINTQTLVLKADTIILHRKFK